MPDKKNPKPAKPKPQQSTAKGNIDPTPSPERREIKASRDGSRPLQSPGKENGTSNTRKKD